MFDLSKLNIQFERVAVEVPEFSAAFTDGRPEMVVRQLTADEKREVLRAVNIRGQFVYYDQALLAFYGTVTGDVDETGLGKRVFKSPDFLRELPETYNPAILRLANAVMGLSGMLPKAEADETTPLEQEKKG